MAPENRPRSAVPPAVLTRPGPRGPFCPGSPGGPRVQYINRFSYVHIISYCCYHYFIIVLSFYYYVIIPLLSVA